MTTPQAMFANTDGYRKVNAYTTIVLAIAIVATLVLMIYLSGIMVERELNTLGGFLLSAFWPISPYIFLAVMSRRRKARGRRLIVYAVGPTIITLLALLVYFDGFFVHGSSTSGLLFVFIPLYQWFAAGILTIAASLVGTTQKERTPVENRTSR